jgi:NADPH-dependent curcumin reductase CurA
MTINRRVILVNRPRGIAQASDFSIDEAPLRDPAPGEIVVANRFLSVEPAMRGWIADRAGYAEPVPIGGVMRALASGHVVASASPDVAVGDAVMGWFGWQSHATVPASAVQRRIPEEELTLSLGILGINGLTAYIGLTQIGAPKPGETVVVSTAAGAVGSAVGQIAKILGCRTVGIAGGPDKARRCREEFGYDEALDYRVPDLGARLAAACPAGIDLFFDNTAGPIADTVLPQLALRARVVCCGTASLPKWEPWPSGPRVERHLLVKRARMEGFVIFDHVAAFDDALDRLRAWLAEGRLTHREEILDGLEACPDALAGLYRGENQGKRLIRLPA